MIRALAYALAANRMAFGIGYLLAPSRTGESWIGKVARDDATRVFTRALGARDLALGAGALASMHKGSDPFGTRAWFAGHAIADGADLLAALAARRRLPKSGLRFALGMAAGSTAIALAAAARPPASRTPSG